MNKLLIVYDYFFPAYQAGGPIQSLTNLAVSLNNNLIISVVTGSFDLHEEKQLDNIAFDKWQSVKLPLLEKTVNVWYAQKLSSTLIKKFTKGLNYNTVYLNGMFSYRFVILPLLFINKSRTKVVLCPRGMLQKGALSGKSLKKRVYLTTLKLFGLVKNITWHATNAEEENDIKKIFGKKSKVIIAANIPKMPIAAFEASQKKQGQLRLVYLSLIAEKKNLLQVIELINQSTADISLDIYGPVKDVGYWKKCEEAILAGKGKIQYMGDVRPELVQQTFSQYDASILLTKGENFGHALYESLSVGRPIITSFFTPWNDMEEKLAGWNLDIADSTASLRKLEAIAAMDNQTFNRYCEGAYEMACSYYAQSSDLTNYHKLFSV